MDSEAGRDYKFSEPEMLKIALFAHGKFGIATEFNFDDKDFQEFAAMLLPGNSFADEAVWHALFDQFPVHGPWPHAYVSPGCMASIQRFIEQKFQDKTHKIELLEREKEELYGRIERLHGFDVRKIATEISAVEVTIAQTRNAISGTKELQSLLSALDPMSNSLATLAAVTKRMDDVYSVLIKPIQEEGRSGIRATVMWAIVSLAVSTAASIGISWYFATHG
jgi:hypothetical protein